MSKSKTFLGGLVLAALFLIVSCSKESKDFNSNYGLFKEYILNFSSGLISAHDDIRVVLAFDIPDYTPNKEIDEDLFTVNPNVKGKVVAMSANTLAFVPNEPLQNNQEYQVSFHLSKLKEVKSELEKFNFTVKTIKQDFVINFQDLQSYSKDYFYLNGVLNTSDNFPMEKANQLISVLQKDKKLSVKIDKEFSNAREFKFVIDSIQRFEEDSKIKVSWDGKDFNIEQKGETEIDIPGKNNFSVLSAEVEEENTQVLLLNFSDPLKKNQDFNGLVQVESANQLKFATAGNLLKVFFTEPLKGELLVEVFQGIESEDGYKLKQNFSQKIAFEQLKPSVRFVKSGTILPSSNNLKINFEAVNLSAVDVKVYKIYKNNVLQFLQDNQLNGNYNLRKVAGPIAKQKVTLKKSNLINYSKWNAYALDLSKIITPEPGAIYRVELDFNKKYSLYKASTSLSLTNADKNQC